MTLEPRTVEPRIATARRRAVMILLALAVSLPLSACGQKGALFLPEDVVGEPPAVDDDDDLEPLR